MPTILNKKYPIRTGYVFRCHDKYLTGFSLTGRPVWDKNGYHALITKYEKGSLWGDCQVAALLKRNPCVDAVFVTICEV